MEINKIQPFNNKVETSLRILCILNEAFPQSFDIQSLVYFDYLSVHSADVDENMESLHPPVPNRSGEIFIRRVIIEEGLDLLLSKNLLQILYKEDGIEYKASESATPFLEGLSSEYLKKLSTKVKWAIYHFSHLDNQSLRKIMQANIEKLKDEFNLELLS